MAWALIFDGDNDYARPSSGIPLTAGDTVNIQYISISVSTSRYFTDSAGSGNRPFLYTPNGNLAWNGAVMNVDLDGVPATSGSTPAPTDTNPHTLTLNITSNCTLGTFCARFNAASPVNIQLLSVIITSGTVTANYDATTSSHEAGVPILNDTVGGNDATGFNMPTDGSAWINLGGEEEELVLSGSGFYGGYILGFRDTII